MKSKLSPAGVLTFLLVVTLLAGCKVDNGDKTDTDYRFDTTVAAKSVIPLMEATQLQQSFINGRTDLGKLITDTGYLSKNFNIPNGEAFSKDALLLLLSQKEADGVRMYYGKDVKGVVRLVLMPIRKDGSVIYTRLIGSRKSGQDSSQTSKSTINNDGDDDDDEAVETGQTCPPCILEQP